MTSDYFEILPPCKAHRSAPSSPTSQAWKMQLRPYLKYNQAKYKPLPLSRPSDAFEISSRLDDQSRAKMEERKSKMFQLQEIHIRDQQ